MHMYAIHYLLIYYKSKIFIHPTNYFFTFNWHWFFLQLLDRYFVGWGDLPQHGPVMLAWAVFRYVTMETDQEQVSVNSRFDQHFKMFCKLMSILTWLVCLLFCRISEGLEVKLYSVMSSSSLMGCSSLRHSLAWW